MGGKSSSKTSSTTNNDNRQFAVQDGIGAFSGGDTEINVTDAGAIEGGLDLAESSVNRALETVDSNSDNAFDFGEKAIDATNKTTSEAFDFGRDLQSEVTGTQRGAFDLVNQGFRQVANLASNAVRGDSGEVADTSKTLITALAVVGGLGLLYAILRGGK